MNDIDELKAEIDRLRAALRRIAESPEADTILILPEGDTVWKFAREALGEL